MYAEVIGKQRWDVSQTWCVTAEGILRDFLRWVSKKRWNVYI